ncbi:hypothetical protein vseg_003488 [Gypsophila vaccaria]
MQMENHLDHHHHPQYNVSDLRQFISTTGGGVPHHFPSFGQPSSLSELMTAHHHHRSSTSTSTTTPAAAAAPTQQHHYNNNNNHNNDEMVLMGRHMGGTASVTVASGRVDMLLHHQQPSVGHHHYQDHFNCDPTTITANYDGGDGGAARWPRQETLTLLEIRSRLDHKFKEANQKGPLWDEVARTMCEDHGYQRSGKKCREKFENLYKYYKKTKEGKAGRQDGKHYRFFRQLEALYGDHNNPISLTSEAQFTETTPQFHPHSTQPQPATLVPPPRGCDTSVSLSNSSDFETSSTDNNDELNGSMESNSSMETNNNNNNSNNNNNDNNNNNNNTNNNNNSNKKKKKKRGYRSNWKAKIKEFIDLQMRKIMEKQETWLEKMMSTLESREHERMVREEEWRKQEADRVEREHKFWASERAWIEARDSALMSALEKLTDHSNNNNNNNINGVQQWPEHEVTRLIQIRTCMESRFQQCGFSEEVLWEDIATKMAYFGYDRSAIVCKEKWDSINAYFRGPKRPLIKDESKKKRQENYKAVCPQNHNHNLNEGGGGIYVNQLSGLNNNCEINEPRPLQLNEESSSPSSHNSNVNNNAVGNVMNDSCLRFFLGDGENNLGWESNYGLKLNNGDNQCA